jgi:hypothetical protein
VTGSPTGGVELTELVAGGWQLRPWPVAHADLDEVLAERYPPEQVDAERMARLDGWSRGDLLGFAVRDITTGASVAEGLVVVSPQGHASVAVRPRLDHLAAGVDGPVEDVVRRWVTGALGLTLT